jgi:hypothetical protein
LIASCGGRAATPVDTRMDESAPTHTARGMAVGSLVRREPLRVGVRARRGSENDVAIEGKDEWGVRVALISGQASEVRVEDVLAMARGEVAKLHVTYEKSTTIVMAPAEQKGVYASAVDGKGYIVESARAPDETRARVTDERGERPAGPELETVIRDYADLGHANPVNAAVPSKPLRQGDRLPALAAAIKERLEERRTAKVDALEATVGGVRVVDGARSIVFELTGRTTLAMHATVVFDLRGEYVVRLDDGWESKFELIGTPASDVATRLADQKPITLDRKKTRFRFTYTVSYDVTPPASR